MRFKILLVTLLTGALFAATPAPLGVYMASESIPPGATVQLKVFLNTGAALVSGSATVTLDSTIFDTITAADVYSATGDQGGAANIQGRQVTFSFGSATGGIGRLPGLPVFTITAPVLPTARPGASFSLSLTGTATDLNGAQYTLTATGGTFTVGGDISVSNVTIAGTQVEIDGGGFTSATQTSIDGAVISSVQIVSAQEINVTLGAPATLDQRRVAVRTPGGSEVDFFPVLHGPYATRPTSAAWTALQPIFPQALSAASYADSTNFRTAGGASTDNSALALQNPGPKTVNVTLVIEGGTYQTPYATESTITLPPGSTYLQTADALGTVTLSNYPAGVLVLPDSPIRVMVVGLPQGWVFPAPLPPQMATLSFYPQTPLTFNWTVGSPIPIAQGVDIFGPQQGLGNVPFNLSTATASGGTWLRISPTTGNACQYTAYPLASGCPSGSAVQVSVNPQGLAPGTYQGTLTVVPATPGFLPQSATLPVTLNVYAQTQLILTSAQSPLSAQFSAGQTTAIQRTLSLSSSADPAPFTVSIAIPSGQKWLYVSPTQGQTPITLTAFFDPTALKTPSDAANITIQGPGNAVSIPVTSQGPSPFGLTPASLTFFAQTGQPSPATQPLFSTDTYGPYILAAQTNTGGNWLSVGANTGPGAAIAIVTANSSGLTAGTYTGAITVTPAPPAAPVQVPVTLTVYNTPPPVTVSPGSVALSAATNSVTVTVSTANVPLTFDTAVSTNSGGNWLYAGLNSASGNLFVTPGSITIGSQITTLPAGTYTGTVTVRAPAGSTNTMTIPVTYVAPGPAAPVPSHQPTSCQ